jgi:hypothetical protein
MPNCRNENTTNSENFNFRHKDDHVLFSVQIKTSISFSRQIN